MKFIAFKSTRPAVITKFTTATLLLLALAACNSGSGGGSSVPIIGKSTSLKPTELVATGFYEGVDLTWKQATGATSYTVYYSKASFKKTTASGVGSKTGITTTNSSITKLENGTLYYLRVEAINAKGKTNLSTEIVTAFTNLQPPTNLKATGVYKGVDLSWDAAKGADRYTVYYSKARFSSATDEGVDNTTYTTTTKASITNLANGTKYYLRVEAIIGDRYNKKLSEEVEATADFQAPILRAIGVNQGVDLSWDAVKYAISYTIYYHNESFNSITDGGVKSHTVTAPTTDTSIDNLINGETYYLRAVTNYGAESSHLSEVVEAKATTQAPKLRAIGVNEAIDLSWDSITGADSYTIYYRTASFDNTTDSGVISTTVTASTTKTSITGLLNGTKYYLRAVTKYPNGYSKLSKQVIVTVNLQPPTNLKATGVNQAIDLSWGKVTGATSYTVYYHTASFDTTADTIVKSQTGITTTDTSIDGLTNGTTYYLRVEVISADGKTKLSKEVTAIPIRLAAPTGLNAMGVYLGIDLSWDKVTGATSYTVYYSDVSFDSSTDSRVASKVNITTDNTRIDGLEDNKTYYFRVIASNQRGNSEMSFPQQSKTLKLFAPRPSAATSIISPAAVDLSWDAVAGNVTNYKIYYAKQSLDQLDGGYLNFAAVGGKDATADATTDISITIGDLSADTTYYFVVTVNQLEGEVAAPEVTADSSYIAELTTGAWHGCVRLNSGSIKCWGRNTTGQLGVGDDKLDVHPATSVSNFRAKQLSAGKEHSCAINLSDKLYCWGSNESEQLGLSDKSTDSPTLVNQDELDTVSLVSAGERTTCALAAGKNYCWGDQYFGALGSGDDLRATTMYAQEISRHRTTITGAVKQFALGDGSGCAIDASNDLWCWGNNNKGQVGEGKGEDIYRASPVKPLLQGSGKATMQISGKNKHYCAVDDAKKVQCWGWNASGQLGINGTAEFNNIPQYVLTTGSKSNHLSGVSKIAVGFEHSCALLDSGKVRCWGKSDDGRIGAAERDDEPHWGPDRLIAGTTDVPGINNAVDIAAGYSFTCVLLAERAGVECWGENGYGQLGNVSTDDSDKPVAVKWQ